MDYKATLNLPKTDFPMKANLPQREPELLASWEQERLYEQIQEAGKGRPRYVLARWAALCQWPNSYRSRAEQDSQRHHRQIQDDGRATRCPMCRDGIAMACRSNIRS